MNQYFNIKNGVINGVSSDMNQYFNVKKSYNLLLDLYPGAEVAYSLVKLRTDYTGAAIRVRRDSDNAEMDIGFRGTELDVTSLLNFVRRGSGFVTTWYDQQGSNNAFREILNEQLKIVNNGVIELSNGRPTMFYENGFERLVMGSLSHLTEGEMFMIIESGLDPTPVNHSSWKFGTKDVSDHRNHYTWNDGNIYDDFGSTARKNIGNPITALDKMNVYNVLSKLNDFKAFVNFEHLYTTTSNIVGFNNEPIIGTNLHTNAFPVYKNRITELIIYPEDKGILRDDIKQNRIDYYGI